MSSFEFTLFLSLSFVAGIMMVVLTIYTFTLPASRASRFFAFMLAAVALWCFAIGGGMFSTNPAIARAWMIMRMIPVILVPPLWFLFTLSYTSPDHRLKVRHYLALSLIPLLSMALLISAEKNALFYVSIEYARVFDYLVEIDWQLGSYFWIHLVYSFLLIVIGDYLLVRHAIQLPQQFRRQSILLALSTLPPLLTNLSMSLNFFPGIHGNYDVAGFVVCGVIIVWVLKQERMLDLKPVAHRLLMETIPDAVFIFDQQNRLIDLNPAALRLFSLPQDELLGKSAELIFTPPIKLEDNPREMEYRFENIHQDSYYQAESIPLVQSQQLMGHVLILRNISEQHRLTQELRQLATTDTLTGIANRRQFFDQSIQFLHYALRYKHDLSLLMIDIDEFKEVNDQHGHDAGDQVLIQLVHILQSNLRSVDILCRYGGEEFCILLPSTDVEASVATAERLRWLVKESDFVVQNQRIRISISIGVASLANEQISLDTMISRADRAMYASKTAGRDRVTLWTPLL